MYLLQKQLNYNKLFHTKSSTKTPVNETPNKRNTQINYIRNN